MLQPDGLEGPNATLARRLTRLFPGLISAVLSTRAPSQSASVTYLVSVVSQIPSSSSDCVFMQGPADLGPSVILKHRLFNKFSLSRIAPSWTGRCSEAIGVDDGC